MSQLLRCPAYGILALCLALAPAWTLEAADSGIARTARVLHQTAAASLVHVGSVIEIDAGMMGGQGEKQYLSLGIVLDDTGLTAVSRTAINPHGYEPMVIEPQPGMEVKFTADLTSVWLQMSDGTRVDAQLVLTDPETDLSFIRPINPKEHSFRPLSVTDSTKSPQLLDSVIQIGRLGEDVGWATQLQVADVKATVETPWKSFVIAAEPGEAVFDQDGGFLGMAVVAPSSAEVDAMAVMMIGPMEKPPTVVLPAARIRKLIQADKSDAVKLKRKPPREPSAGQGMGGPGGMGSPGGMGGPGGPGGMKDPTPGIQPGQSAPAFNLIDELGNQHSLEKYRGKYVLLDWWGMW